jgi:hypothetical protein
VSRVPLAVAGARPLAQLDAYGNIAFDDGWRVEWWVGGDDQWHVPSASASVRQRSVDHTPVVETAMRVPGGDVVWRTGAVSVGDAAVVAIEFENQATIPVAIGVALIAPDDAAFGRLSVDGATVFVDGVPRVQFSAPARRDAASAPGGVNTAVFVHPVSHTTTWRCVLGDAEPSAVAPLDAVARGWLVLARQGAQITTNDPNVDDALVAARTSLLAHVGALREPRRGEHVDRDVAAAVAAALTYVGSDDEAGPLRLAARIRPPRRGLPVVAPFAAPVASYEDMAILSDAATAAATVAAVRAGLVGDDGDAVDLAPGYDETWRGRSVDVVDLPVDAGTLSYAIRWHGDRPAVLWDLTAKKATPLRARVIDPTWSTREPRGEALLAAPADAPTRRP